MTDHKLKETRKIGDTEFVHDPEAFIQFLRSEEHARFGKGSLVAAGTVVVKPLIQHLINEHENNQFCNRIIEVLSEIGVPAISPLLGVLKQYKLDSRSSSKIIGLVASALGSIGNKAVDPLIEALNSDLLQVRFGAAVALGQIQDTKGIDAIHKAIREGDQKDQVMFKMILGEK